jgi:lysozyme
MAASGIRFVIVKVSEGASYRDPRRLEYLDGARKAGMLVGVYHFLYPSQPLAQQAELLWHATGDTMPDLPPVIDFETKGGTTAAGALAACEDFVGEVCARFGPRPPILYTYPSFWQSITGLSGRDLTWAAELPLWIAHYKHYSPHPPTSQPIVPKPWKRWTMWQSSGGGPNQKDVPVAGVSVPCDRNWFDGDEVSLRALCGFAPATEPPPSMPPNDSAALAMLAALKNL